MGAKVVENLTTPFLHTEGLNSRTEKFIHETTLYVLIAIAVFLASKPMFGTSIICQVPKDWPTSSISYYHSFCYYAEKQRVGVSRTYNRGEGRGNMTVNVLTGKAENYLWIPFIGFLQVALCLLPALFWKFVGLNFFHGSDIVCLLETYKCDDVMDQLADIDWKNNRRAHQVQKWISAKSQAMFGKSRTLLIYVLMKWLRLILFIFQFWLNAKLFAARDLKWGMKIAIDFIKGVYINPLRGELSLMTGCEVQRLQMATGLIPGEGFTRANSVLSRCILSGNFINSKAFLFLYWWFLLLILVCLFSAIRYTAILICPRYRRFLFKSFIRDESYYIDLCGHPHPELNMGMTEPMNYISDYLGNDGYLLWQIIFDDLHYFGSDQLTKDIFTLCIVKNNEENVERKEKRALVDDTHHDGGGDRFIGGKEGFPSRKDYQESYENIGDQYDNEKKRNPMATEVTDESLFDPLRSHSPSIDSFDSDGPSLLLLDSHNHRS